MQRWSNVLFFLVLSILNLTAFAAATSNKKPAFSITTMANNDSTVLRELKETIRKQAQELASLKMQLKKGKGTSAPSAHGGGGEESAVDLSTSSHSNE
jgi:hypothetical protein